jgi:hypothetical protein
MKSKLQIDSKGFINDKKNNQSSNYMLITLKMNDKNDNEPDLSYHTVDKEFLDDYKRNSSLYNRVFIECIGTADTCLPEEHDYEILLNLEDFFSKN